jgi:hypothetical protein
MKIRTLRRWASVWNSMGYLTCPLMCMFGIIVCIISTVIPNAILCGISLGTAILGFICSLIAQGLYDKTLSIISMRLMPADLALLRDGYTQSEIKHAISEMEDYLNERC